MSFSQLLSQQAAILAQVMLESQDPDERGLTMPYSLSVTLSNAELSRGVVPHLFDGFLASTPGTEANSTAALDYACALSQDFHLTTSTVCRMHEKLRHDCADEAKLHVPTSLRGKLFLEQKRFEKLTAATERGFFKYANTEDSLERFAHLLALSAVFYAHFTHLAPFEQGNELTARLVVFAILARVVAVPFPFPLKPATHQTEDDFNLMKAPLRLCKEMLRSVRTTSSEAAYLSLE